jgi:acetyl esterase
MVNRGFPRRTARLHPDAAAVLERVRVAGIPQWHTMTVDRGREVYLERARLFAGTKEPAGQVSDGEIAAPGRAIPIRVYRPEGRASPPPIFVYLHGGGWTFGDLDSHDHLCRRIAAATGALLVSVAYRLGPEHRAPEQLDDVIEAVRWLREHGNELGGDPSRMAMGGDSAGGNLTAGAALKLRDTGEPNIDLQVLIYPATAPYFDTLSYHQNGEGYWLTRDDVIWFWDNFLGPDPAARADPYAAPGILDAQKLRGLPPALIITAAFDPLRDEGEVYGLKLNAAGVPVHVRRFNGMIHGFVALPTPIPAGVRAVQMIADATRRTWRGR